MARLRGAPLCCAAGAVACALDSRTEEQPTSAKREQCECRRGDLDQTFSFSSKMGRGYGLLRARGVELQGGAAELQRTAAGRGSEAARPEERLEVLAAAAAELELGAV